LQLRRPGGTFYDRRQNNGCAERCAKHFSGKPRPRERQVSIPNNTQAPGNYCCGLLRMERARLAVVSCRDRCSCCVVCSFRESSCSCCLPSTTDTCIYLLLIIVALFCYNCCLPLSVFIFAPANVNRSRAALVQQSSRTRSDEPQIREIKI